MRNSYGVPKNKQIKQSAKVVKNTSNVIPHRSKPNRKRPRQRPLQRRGSTPNLTVIEGKKGKKKNRALF